MIVKIKDVIGTDNACGEECGALLFEALCYALEQKRTEKVIVDFSDMLKMDAEFLATGIISLLGVYNTQDLVNNLDFSGITAYYFRLLKRIGDAYLAKKRDVVDFMAYVREVKF